MRTKLLLLLLIFAVAIGTAKNNARATVVMKDGGIRENVEIQLPKGWDKKLKIKVNNTETTLMAEDVDHFILWHIDNPENKAVIKYIGIGSFNHKKKEYDLRDSKGWMSLYSAGEQLSYWIWFNKIKLKAKDIKYEVDDNAHYFLKKGSEHAIRIPVNLLLPGKTRDWLKAFLEDDPVLVNNITEKGYYNKKKPYHQGNNYNPFFFEDIAEDYNPVR